jgi:protein gp37
MSDNTKIEWTDATWNPITGCSVVSPGCTNCYAQQLAGTRLRNHPSRAGLTRESAGRHVWNGQVRFNVEWLDEPLRWRRPRMIFVCAHGDLFHESVPDEWISAVFGIMAAAPHHTYQVLTKRPERAYAWFARMKDASTAQGYLHEAVKSRMGYDNPRRPAVNITRWPLPNVWLGVSVEDQRRADERIALLIATPSAVRWISAEPLLGPIEFRWKPYAHEATGEEYRDYLERVGSVDQYEALRKIDWVVAGGESGHNARPMHPDWARSLRDQCFAAGVPFFFKQWGEYATLEQSGLDLNECYAKSKFGGWVELDGKHSIGEGAYPLDTGAEHVFGLGKKHSGRLLDGVEHNAYPVTP